MEIFGLNDSGYIEEPELISSDSIEKLVNILARGVENFPCLEEEIFVIL